MVDNSSNNSQSLPIQSIELDLSKSQDVADKQASSDESANYDAAYVDNLIMQHEYAKERAEKFQEGFAAIADMLYEALAYINATRIFADKRPIMADDINRLIESNPILNQMTNELRKASIESGLGMVSQMGLSQDNLRNTVMAHWHRRMHDPKLRQKIAEQLFPKQDNKKPKNNTIKDPDDLFSA